MLLYNNRSFFRLVLTWQGTIFWRPTCLLGALFCAAMCVLFRFLTDIGFPIAVELQQSHHYGMQALGSVVAFAVVFRCNLGWQRYWEAVSHLHFMYSKWGDAYSQLCAFVSVTKERAAAGLQAQEDGRAKGMRAEAGLDKLTQNFVLLSSIAADCLVHGDAQRMEWRAKVAPWSKQIVKREMLRTEDLTGAWNLPAFEEVSMARNSQISSLSRRTSRTDAGLMPAIGEMLAKCPANALLDEQSSNSLPAPPGTESNAWNGVRYLVLAEPTESEKMLLRIATDRASVVMNWIIHDIAALSPDMDAAPPIQSRMYQELSNGMLAFKMAMKLGDVPFPFPFAQILSLLLTIFTFLIPIYMIAFTDSQTLAPLLSFGLCMGMWGLNETAIELENPLGSDVNDILLMDFHLRFIDMVQETQHAHAWKGRLWGVYIARDIDRKDSAQSDVRSAASSSARASAPAQPLGIAVHVSASEDEGVAVANAACTSALAQEIGDASPGGACVDASADKGDAAGVSDASASDLSPKLDRASSGSARVDASVDGGGDANASNACTSGLRLKGRKAPPRCECFDASVDKDDHGDDDDDFPRTCL